ncbi:hypothetical protein Fmac_003972 [Flemingia macrophylla]|uniref:beta-ketoacyl-[acyl-carrier-protein] synthase I n=1 Tax=Flemingia macrophylla TaxID=520843 RepID=A0ABD1N3K6_9FABA
MRAQSDLGKKKQTKIRMSFTSRWLEPKSLMEFINNPNKYTEEELTLMKTQDIDDAIEANAIKIIFFDRASSSALAFSSTKGAIGHLLGAVGAVETIFAVLSIQHRIAPLTFNLTKSDPVFGNGFMSLFASKEMPIRVAMSNSWFQRPKCVPTFLLTSAHIDICISFYWHCLYKDDWIMVRIV